VATQPMVLDSRFRLAGKMASDARRRKAEPPGAYSSVREEGTPPWQRSRWF
jgi:hypothetical protein